jgi:hypothetical protein
MPGEKPESRRPHHDWAYERHALMHALKQLYPDAYHGLYDAVFRGYHIDAYERDHPDEPKHREST